MPKKGSNFIPLVLDTRLLVAVNGKASQKQQLNATYIMSVLVEHCKNDLESEAYKELKQRYSKTVYEQKREKAEKLRRKIEREEEKLRLKKRELAIKEKTAKSFQKQTDSTVIQQIVDLKRNLKERKKALEYAQKHRKFKYAEECKRNIEILTEQLKQLGVDTEPKKDTVLQTRIEKIIEQET